jgi:hypothetical protein
MQDMKEEFTKGPEAPKNSKSQLRAAGMAQVVEHLPRKCESLSSNCIQKKFLKKHISWKPHQ